MKSEKIAYKLLFPMIFIMLSLVFYPILETFSYSLKRWKLTKPNDIKFIGFRNYINIIKSQAFRTSIVNTMYILFMVIIITMIISTLVALFLNIKVKFSGILLAIAILPWALPPFINGILWRFVFYSGYGFLNKLLINLKLIEKPIEWLNSRFSLLTIVSLVCAYRVIPFVSLVLLSGLKSIDKNLIEAAKIDGANNFLIIRKIISPLMLPFILLAVSSTSISAVNVFDEIVSLSGYSNIGKSLLIESYLTTFSFMDFGKGSAYTYILMFLAGILGYFYIRTVNKEEN